MTKWTGCFLKDTDGVSACCFTVLGKRGAWKLNKVCSPILDQMKLELDRFNGIINSKDHGKVERFYDEYLESKEEKKRAAESYKEKMKQMNTPVSNLLGSASSFIDLELNNPLSDDLTQAELEMLAGSYSRNEAPLNGSLINEEMLEAIDACRSEIVGGSLTTYQMYKKLDKMDMLKVGGGIERHGPDIGSTSTTGGFRLDNAVLNREGQSSVGYGNGISGGGGPGSSAGGGRAGGDAGSAVSSTGSGGGGGGARCAGIACADGAGGHGGCGPGGDGGGSSGCHT